MILFMVPPRAATGPADEFDLPGLSGRFGRSALVALRDEVAAGPPTEARDRLAAALDGAIRGLEAYPPADVDRFEAVFRRGSWSIEPAATT